MTDKKPLINEVTGNAKTKFEEERGAAQRLALRYALHCPQYKFRSVWMPLLRRKNDKEKN